MAEQSLMDRLNQGGIPQPTTAFGANSLGATPQEAAMAGTDAAKKAKIKKEQTLSGTQRLQDQVLAEPSVGMRQAEQQAKQIQAVGGSLTGRIQTAVQKQLQTIETQQAGQAQVNQTALGSALGLSGTLEQQRQNPVYQKASTALLKFANNPSEDVKIEVLKELRAAGIADDAVADLITVTAQAVGKTATAPTKGPVAVEDLDLTGLAEGVDNIDQLATTLGIDKTVLSKVSVDKLPALIQDIQQKEAATAQALRAQLASLPTDSQQYAIAKGQLQQLQGAGVESAETKITKTVQDLNLADEISIGGVNYSAKDLFEDEQLSNIITNWMLATTPAARESIISSKDYPGMVDWLAKNEAALGDLVTKTGEAVKTTSTAIAVQDKADYDASLEGQLVNGGNQGAWDAISALPEADKAVALALTPAEISSAYQAAQTLMKDPALAKLVGADFSKGFVFDPQAQAKLAEYTPAVAAVQTAGHPEWLEDPAFSSLSPANMVIIANAKDGPSRVANLKTLRTNKEVATPLINADIRDPDTHKALLKAVTGNDAITIQDLNNQYRTASHYAKLGDKDAQNRKTYLERKFGYSEKRAQFGAEHASNMRGQLMSILARNSEDVVINGGQVEGINYLKDTADIGIQTQYTPPVGSLHERFGAQLEDGKIDTSEMEQAIALDSGIELKKLLNTMPNGKDYLKIFKKTYDKVNDTKARSAADKITSAAGAGSLDEFNRNLNNATISGYTPEYAKMLDDVKNQLSKLGKDDPTLKTWTDAMVGNIIARQDKLAKDLETGKRLAGAAVDWVPGAPQGAGSSVAKQRQEEDMNKWRG